jgi:hypothetical protein
LGIEYAIAIDGGNMFIANTLSGTISEYTTSGTLVNASLISGLNNHPFGIAIDSGNLYIASREGGTVGEYTESGATVNASLISGLNGPVGVAIVGGNMYVSSYGSGSVGEYTLSGTAVNTSLIPHDLNGPYGIVVVAEAPESASASLLIGGLGVIGLLQFRRKLA